MKPQLHLHQPNNRTDKQKQRITVVFCYNSKKKKGKGEPIRRIYAMTHNKRQKTRKNFTFQ